MSVQEIARHGFLNLMPSFPQGRSSIGRVSVSKTEGWGFEALRPCH